MRRETIGMRFERYPARQILVAAALDMLVVVILLCTMSVARAQQLTVSPTPPKQMSITVLTDDLKRYLESTGYTDVTLTPSDKGIVGFATKSDRTVEIIFDEKGRLNIK